MQQPTGSVYLDAPSRPPRRPPSKNRRRTRARLAGAFVAIGVLSLTFASVVAGLRYLVLDPDPTLDAVDAAFDDPIGREELQAEVAAGIEHGLIGEELVTVAALYGFDVAEEASEVALAVIDDPLVREQFRLVASDLHSRLVVESNPTAVDLAPLTAAVLAVLDREAPDLAAMVPADTVLWTIEGDSLPDLGAVSNLMDRAFFSLILAALLIPAGLLLHPRRHRVAAWIGRSAIAFGVLCALAAVGLPYLISALTGFSAAEIAVRSVSLKLIAPAAISGIAGMGLVSLAAVLKHREQRQVTDEGAAAALGYDEPPLRGGATAPTLDLGSRGLIDVSHPLTNV